MPLPIPTCGYHHKLESSETTYLAVFVPAGTLGLDVYWNLSTSLTNQKTLSIREISYPTSQEPFSMFYSFPSTQTVSCTFMYISFFSDRLFKTECNFTFHHWILWRYETITSGCSDYVLYIFERDKGSIVAFAQNIGVIRAF